MNELLFPPATRTSHPETSKIAEAKITNSGKRRTHCQIVLDCLGLHNGSTTKELADYLIGILTHPQVHKRMSDLRRNNYVRRNEMIVRDGQVTWFIK